MILRLCEPWGDLHLRGALVLSVLPSLVVSGTRMHSTGTISTAATHDEQSLLRDSTTGSSVRSLVGDIRKAAYVLSQ